MANWFPMLWLRDRCKCSECRNAGRVYRMIGPGFFWRIA